jgi:hypothetical protein
MFPDAPARHYPRGSRTPCGAFCASPEQHALNRAAAHGPTAVHEHDRLALIAGVAVDPAIDHS